jgi:hypothetical protein
MSGAIRFTALSSVDVSWSTSTVGDGGVTAAPEGTRVWAGDTWLLCSVTFASVRPALLTVSSNDSVRVPSFMLTL